MQPLDINHLNSKIVSAIKNNNPDSIEGVLSELSNRIHLAINPLSSASAPLALLALRLYIKMINDMSPGADELANAYGKMFSVTSIKIPASQKKSTPGAMRLRCNAAPDITPERSQARVNAERGAYIPAWRDTLIPNKEAYYMDVTTDAITYLKLEATRLTEQYLLMQTVAEQAQENLQIALERLKAAEDDNRTLRAKLQQYEEPSAP